MDVFARRIHTGPGVDQARDRPTVSELCDCFDPRLSLYQPGAARFLSRCSGLAGVAKFPLSRGHSFLARLRRRTHCRAGDELSSHCRIPLRRSHVRWILRSSERQPDSSYARHRSPGKSARLVRGRKAALISDVHLGHVRNGNFLRRMVAKIRNEKPDAIFIAGDLYDGTAIDAGRAAEPLNELSAPHGVYFVAGNHEQFGDDSKYLRAIAAAGVRVLTNEKVDVDGLQILGVPYRNATQKGHLASELQKL